jgi:hypothetical protein
VADPFLDADEFATQFGRDLSDAEQPQAERLLQVVSDWIRDKLAPAVLADDNPAAQQVVFEVVRDAITFGGYERLKSFTNTTSRRTESGEFDESMKAVDDWLTDRHKRLLGIALRTGPRGYFPKCDY